MAAGDGGRCAAGGPRSRGDPGASVLPAIIAAALVEVTLLARLVVVAGDRRGSARDLIAAGRADLPVAAVQRERARLLDARHVADLARSLDDLRLEAHAPYRDRPREHPLHAPSTVRRVDRELRSVIALLREPCPDLAFVARIEGLLSSPSSPLYGDDATRLRDELLRIAFVGRELRPGSRSPAPLNRALPRTLLAFVVAAIVAASCAPQRAPRPLTTRAPPATRSNASTRSGGCVRTPTAPCSGSASVSCRDGRDTPHCRHERTTEVLSEMPGTVVTPMGGLRRAGRLALRARTTLVTLIGGLRRSPSQHPPEGSASRSAGLVARRRHSGPRGGLASMT